MVNIVALMGSPRVQGQTSLAVEAVLKGAAACGEINVGKIWLNQLKITPCQSCDSCTETGCCRLRDDMGKVYQAIIAADALILAAPIYFSGISAQAKLMVDRCQPFWAAKYVLKTDVFDGRKRPGIFIATGGQPLYEGQFIGSVYVVNLLFKMIGVKNIGNLTLPDVDNKPLTVRPDAVAQALELGKALMRAE